MWYGLTLERSRLECEVGGGGNGERPSCASRELVDGGAPYRAAADMELPGGDGGGGGGFVSAALRRRLFASRSSSVPVARPAVLCRAVATAAAATGDEQLLEPGAKLVAEETVDERVDTAVGGTGPLSHRYYHLHTRHVHGDR